MTGEANMNDRCIQGLEAVGDRLRGCVLTIGNFDGVHVGHRHIIDVARKLAARDGAAVVALTFDPPAELVLQPNAVARRISPPWRKCELLLEAGADFVVTLRTDRELLAKDADEFIDEIIVAAFAPSHVVEGPNFFFGRDRKGNVETLARRGAGKEEEKEGEKGFGVEIVEPVMLDLDGGEVRVSSTLVRRLLAAGRVEDAARCLRYDFTLYGRVVPGRQRGRMLDYPTANVDAGEQITPGDGIYAARARVRGVEYPAAVSIGCNPTFGADTHAIEAFLLNAEGNLYDEALSISFSARLRDMRRFNSPEELKAQIARDVQRVREILG